MPGPEKSQELYELTQAARELVKVDARGLLDMVEHGCPIHTLTALSLLALADYDVVDLMAIVLVEECGDE
jgi:hypothetical protein